MEKRVFLAILLSFVVLAVYQMYFVPPAPPTDLVQTPAVTSTPGATPATVGAPTAAAVEAAPGRAAVATLVADSAARDIIVETDTVQAVFTTEGATLRHWRLNHYRDAAGAPLDLVPSELPGTQPRPFTMATDTPEVSETLRRALYLPSADALALGAKAGTLTFEYKDASGLHARKTFQFQPEGKAYLLRVEASIDVSGASRPVTLEWGPGVGIGYRPDGSREVPAQGLLYQDGKVKRLPAKTIAETPHYDVTPKFAGVEEQYFLSAVLPATQAVKLDFQTLTLPVKNDPKLQRHFAGYSVGVPGAASLTYYMGPKEFDSLHGVEPELVKAIDFGIFSFLVVPLLKALKWFNTYLHNWGWSIIALTVTINIIIFPLRHRSMVSMKKMQAIQPEMKAIQDRYAKYKVTDPERQKMNTEMWALYKQKGVSPASGCVPMLLTLPILYAFYSLLYSSIELRGAPFMGWIRDLSLHDPYYITPVIMGATMFWQQRMMPATADPVQAKMFLFLPLVFTVTFLWVPSGLVLYWLVSNILTIGQQYLTNRIIATPARPARRT